MVHYDGCAQNHTNHWGEPCKDVEGVTLPRSKQVTDQLLSRIADRAGGIASVADEMLGAELEPTLEKIGYTPDHPRVEVRYYDPNGLQIEISIEVPDEIKPYYDADMALNSAGYAVQRLMSQVQMAKRNHEHPAEEPNDD
jgi:hypothetical protein